MCFFPGHNHVEVHVGMYSFRHYIRIGEVARDGTGEGLIVTSMGLVKD